jgi:hypothetical protein
MILYFHRTLLDWRRRPEPDSNGMALDCPWQELDWHVRVLCSPETALGYQWPEPG